MRPHLIYFALTSTALIISGCSSTRSISSPFRGTTGVTSSATDFNEYDRDPPAPRQSPRMAAEPSPVPPARGISLSRIIDATPAGFRRAIGCGDSCTGDAQAAAPCGTDGCSNQAIAVRVERKRLFDFRLLKHKPLGCFKKLCGGRTDRTSCTVSSSCTDSAVCTDQGCNTCAAPSTYCPPPAAGPTAQDCYSESRPRIAPPLGERQPEYDDRPESGHTLQQDDNSSNADPNIPGMVPDIPVDPIGQTRPVQPRAWRAQPLFGVIENAGQDRKPVIHLEPPVWRTYAPSSPHITDTQNQLFPTATRLRTPTFNGVSNETSEIDIQPLIRIEDPATSGSL